ncbi:hypothetical protein Moror_1941 [Moniliophthora roreri MCA 2997]|uniref:CFEM domain-containing protein n=2 Tax=Moniliophthora roreri TaxID=221103 RepID=V2X1F8_MONRO|nr:hypothetical protein Moror_1941 [Moniliophthora roreri MCA 2997]KAI3609643.1 hypothetical protein WG66_001333 [Moniliophthora roreri]
MHLSLFTVFLGAALLVGAQDSTGGAPAAAPAGAGCVIQCSTQALPAGPCSAITDFDCVCTNEAYQQAVRDCLSSSCPPEDMQTAMNLQQQGCGSRTPSAPSGGGSAPAPEPSGPSTTSGGETSTAPPPPSSSAPAPTTTASAPKPTTTGTRPAATSTAAPSTTATGNAAQGQAASMFTSDVMAAVGMVWVGVFLGVLVA